MPETTRFLTCPNCGNTKFMAYTIKRDQEQWIRVYCDDYGCDWYSGFMKATGL